LTEVSFVQVWNVLTPMLVALGNETDSRFAQLEKLIVVANSLNVIDFNAELDGIPPVPIVTVTPASVTSVPRAVNVLMVAQSPLALFEPVNEPEV